MADKYKTRTLSELAIGRTNSVSIESLINIRQQDLDWWNDDIENHERQLFKLIGREIIPVECMDDIEQLNVGGKLKRRKQPNDKKESMKKSQLSIKGKKNKRINDTKNTKKDQNELTSKNNSKLQHSIQEFTNLFGDSIQIIYKIEEISTSNCATILFSYECDIQQPYKKKRKQDSTDLSNKNSKNVSINSGFKKVIKIPKRIILWIYPFDPNNPLEPIPNGGGFPRPEFIPISDLFKHDEEA